jgi:hypothetical protein
MQKAQTAQTSHTHAAARKFRDENGISISQHYEFHLAQPVVEQPNLPPDGTRKRSQLMGLFRRIRFVPRVAALKQTLQSFKLVRF